jgi:hypothetical protein
MRTMKTSESFVYLKKKFFDPHIFTFLLSSRLTTAYR